VTIGRRLSDITKEVDIAVHTLCSYPEMNNPIKMEVGIEDCLHIEFEYNKSKYHLKDTIIGKIYFLLVRIKIKHMEIAIIKKECTGTGPNMFSENETITKYEIMDGAPVKGESIPIRVFLAGYNLTPTMRDINKKFSVKYFLNLVLMDTEDRRYFKQQEITLWRKADLPRHHGHNQHQQIQTNSQHHPSHAPAHLVGSPASAIHKTKTATVSTVDEFTSTERQPSESKMGLFTRESPNQEFSQHEDSTSTSPTSPTSSSQTNSNVNVKNSERGTADGAAGNSPVFMWSTTPPPLKPPTKENRDLPTNPTNDSILEDEINEENDLTNVSLTNDEPLPISTTPTPTPAEIEVETETETETPVVEKTNPAELKERKESISKSPETTLLAD